MNNSEYNQLLSEALLLPFINLNFNKEDLLRDFSHAYKQLVCGERNCGEPTHKNAKEALNRTKQKILEYFSVDPRWNHLDDVQMLMDAFYPGYNLISYYDEKNNDIGKFYLQHIFNVARTFITFRDGVPSVRSWADREEKLLNNYEGMHKIELWNNITRTIPPDLFIAATYVNFNVKDIEMLVNVPNLVMLADVPLSRIFKKGVAETHLHMNVGFSYSYVWKSCVGLFNDPQKTKELWFCTLFRLYSAIFIQNRPKENFLDFIENLDLGCEAQDLHSKFFLKFIVNEEVKIQFEQNLIFEFKSKINKLYGGRCDSLSDILFDTVYYKYSELGTSSEIIWYFNMLSYLKENYDAELCNEFLMYIRYKSNFFKDKIQRNKIGGLDYFQRIYNNAANFLYDKSRKHDDVIEETFYCIFEEQCRTGNLEILEVKISPRILSSNNINTFDIDEIKRKNMLHIKKIIKAYYNYINKTVSYSKNPEKLRFPKLGITYHFIKQNDCDNFSGYSCALSENYAELDCRDYRTMRILNLKFAEAFKIIMKEYPLLAKYIVGIDAASLENSAEPWVFAPIFKAFRSSNYVLPASVLTRERVNNIGFTYHVGEDFRHIASGLRHIDEVLTYFNYCSGDRLGHAIALGVDINKLMSQNRVVVLPIMEHLENLLWMWSKSSRSSKFKTPHNLEYMIMDIAQRIYPNIEGINVYTLWQVYNEKFNMLDNYKIKELQKDGLCRLNLSEIKEYDFNSCRWNKDKLLCTHYCPCYYEQYNKPIFVRISDEEILLYKALQQSLREKVEKLGIYVETNPSSNTAISDIDGIYTHPILNLNDKGLGLNGDFENCVMTTINSDDPMVFSTCVENEIAYVYYGLLNAGCKRENVLEWVDKIRKHGIDSTFIKYDATYKEMLADFEIIMNYPID
ncbi:MAG: hypothetical protein HDT21_04865 [Ruminococcus sp.]|nr:hypothetical protein [Ruminococcus sp.]